MRVANRPWPNATISSSLPQRLRLVGLCCLVFSAGCALTAYLMTSTNSDVLGEASHPTAADLSGTRSPYQSGGHE